LIKESLSLYASMIKESDESEYNRITEILNEASSFQKMILGKIKQMAESAGFEYHITYEYSNIGKIRIMKDMKSVLGIYTNFQSDNAEVIFYKGGRDINGSSNGSLLSLMISYDKDLKQKMNELERFIKTELKNR
jgi:hypothetical protein